MYFGIDKGLYGVSKGAARAMKMKEVRMATPSAPLLFCNTTLDTLRKPLKRGSILALYHVGAVISFVPYSWINNTVDNVDYEVGDDDTETYKVEDCL